MGFIIKLYIFSLYMFSIIIFCSFIINPFFVHLIKHWFFFLFLYTYMNFLFISFFFRLLYVLWSKYIDDYVCMSASYNVLHVSSYFFLFLYRLMELWKKYIFSPRGELALHSKKDNGFKINHCRCQFLIKY
jgi:hypothetical protein